MPNHIVMFFVAIGLAAVATPSVLAHEGDEPLPPPEHREDAQTADFFGVWEGRWDGTWGVRFTITPARDDQAAEEGKLHVLYEWEERIGQPYRTLILEGVVKDGVLDCELIEIYPHPQDRKRVNAIGHFRQERAAALERVEDDANDGD